MLLMSKIRHGRRYESINMSLVGVFADNLIENSPPMSLPAERANCIAMSASRVRKMHSNVNFVRMRDSGVTK